MADRRKWTFKIHCLCAAFSFIFHALSAYAQENDEKLDFGGPAAAGQHGGLGVAGAEVSGGPGSKHSSDPRCKATGNDWNWFSDHVASSITYVVKGPMDRVYEVGTGVSAFGKPLGSIARHSGKIEVTAYGIGSIHVKVADGGIAMMICVAQGDLSTIKFIDTEF